MNRSIENLIKDYQREEINYDDIMLAINSFSESDRQVVITAMTEKQRTFWDDQLDYYLNLHPQLPLVEDHINDFVGRLMGENSNIKVMADLGCGYGKVTMIILNAYPGVEKMIGVEYAPSMIAQAKKHLVNFKNKLNLQGCDFSSGIVLTSESVGTVYSNWGIAYLGERDLLRMLKEIHRVLISSGRFGMSALIKGTKMAGLKRLLGVSDLLWKGKLIQAALKFEKRLKILFPMYTVRELVDLTEQAGFKVVDTNLTLRDRSVTIIAQKI